MQLAGLYIIPTTAINPLYNFGQVLCLGLIILVILASIIELNKLGRLILSSISLLVAVIHYYTLTLLLKYESIVLLPFLVIEDHGKYSAVSLDYGQILLIMVVVLYHREVWRTIMEAYRRLRKIIGGKQIKTPNH